ncbi:required for drug-induced death protein 1 [Odontesthes bonariensis]|uniref:required for drug-induced death protein 1 n=1 Tax=Odontesthes bonariensis TaxID=219752 RepID=UPI003F583C19
MGAQEQEGDGAPSAGKKPQKTSKEVYFSVLPDKYEPLIEEEERDESEEERQRRKEEKKRKRRKRCKKYRKNVGKALRYSWRCLLAGLQNMASTYSTPLSAVATVVTVNRTGGS